ncbi:MAG: YIP1 family protein [Proteobacteria bacterium]|nr:YIP1 family protein [Pseudomonadota bacterium]
MDRVFLRAIRITIAPGEEWQTVRGEVPDQVALLGRFILPLSCIPAAGWATGLGLSGSHALIGHSAAHSGIAQAAHAGLTVLLGAAISVYLLAAALYALAPLFTGRRDWPRALQVAAYSSTPVLLSGVVLVLPDLAFTLILAALHSLALLHGGVKSVLGAKSDESAEYTALAMVIFLLASTALGALGSRLGVA